MRIVFCGTPACTLPALNFLHNHLEVDIQMVVTMPDRPAGRGKQLSSPPVAQFAKEHQIALLQTSNINKESSFLEFLSEKKIDAILVFAFAQFFGSKILNHTPCFNVHTSLLPKYRGAAPVQYALLNGDTETGVTVQKMVKKMDAGDIVVTIPVSIDSHDNGETLLSRLQDYVPVALDKLIADYQSGNLSYTPQDESQVSFAPSIPKSMGQIDFCNHTTSSLINLSRALSPKPGLFCFFGKKRLKILTLEPSNQSLHPGEVSTKYEMLTVGTKDGSVRLTSIQIEGKKCCDDRSFINGFKQIIPRAIIKET